MAGSAGMPLRPCLRERRRPGPMLLRAARQHPPGPGGSSSDSEGEPAQEVLSESELEEEGGPAAARRRQEGGQQATWQQRVLSMPLEAAATLSKEDAHYLEKRSRSRWWKRAKFPRVPDEGKTAPPELQVRGCTGQELGARACARHAASVGRVVRPGGLAYVSGKQSAVVRCQSFLWEDEVWMLQCQVWDAG